MRLFYFVMICLFCCCGYCADSVCETNTLYSVLESFVPLHLMPGSDDLRRIHYIARTSLNTTKYTISIPMRLGITQSFSFVVHTMPYNGTGTSVTLETDPVSIQAGNDSLEIKPITIRIARDASNMLREFECSVPRLDVLDGNGHIQLINGSMSLAVSDGKYGVQLYSLQVSMDEYNFIEQRSTKKERAYLWDGSLNIEMTENDDTVAVTTDLCSDRIVIEDMSVSAITTKFELARLDSRSLAILQNIGRELYRISFIRKSQEEMELTAALAGMQALATVPAFLRRNLEGRFNGRGLVAHAQNKGVVQVNANAGLNTGHKPVIIDPLEFIRSVWASAHADFPKVLLPPGENPGPFIQKEDTYHFDFTCTNGTATLNGAEIPVKLEDLMSNTAVQQVF